MPERIPKSTAKKVVFRAIASSDHFTPATGKTIAITISKNGATSFSNPNAGATNATEMASGFYKFDLDTTDTGTSGPLAWRAAGTGIDDVGDVYEVVNATNGGFTALPDTACTTNASLLTSGTGTDQISVASGRVDLGKALGTAVTLDSNNVLNVSAKYLAGTALTGRDIGTSVLVSAGTGTGQLDFTSGVVKANATQWLGGTIPAVNVTGVPLVDLKYVLGTISPAAAGSVRADAVTGAVGSVTGAVGSVTGNVGGNVTGSVGSVASGGISSSSFASGAIGANELAADAVTEIAAGMLELLRTSGLVEVASGSPGEYEFTADALRKAPTGSGGGGGSCPSAADIADAVWDEALAGHAIAGSAGDYLGAIPTATENADELLNRDMSAVSDTNARSPLNALRAIRNKWSVAAGTYTVRKEDDTTTAWTASVSTDAAADPVTGSDPA
jgi:hypothetical protein